MEPSGIVLLAITGVLIIAAAIAGIVGAVKERQEQQQQGPAATATVARPPVRVVPPTPALPHLATLQSPTIRVGPSRPYSTIQQRSIVPSGRSALHLPGRTSPLWEEKGWRRNSNTYQGVFRAKGRQWQGRIEVPYRGCYTATIWNPPITALFANTHRQRYCFQSKGNGQYNVHFHEMPACLDQAIGNIEQILHDVS